MLRINHNALAFKKGKYFFEGLPFTGISFQFENGFLKEKYEFFDGLKKGTYKRQLIPHSGLVEVHMEEALTMADFPEVTFYINGDEHVGEEFSGYAYSFEGDYCTSEYLIENSWPDSQVWYDKSGNIIYFKYSIDNKNFIRQIVKYHKNNSLNELEVRLDVATGFAIRFNKNNSFAIFSILGDFFNEVKKRMHAIIVPVFEHEDTITNYYGGERVYLNGNGINEKVMRILLINNTLCNVKELVIGRDVFFKKSLFKDLVENTNLEVLRLNSEKLTISDLLDLKGKLLNCEIIYNHRVI